MKRRKQMNRPETMTPTVLMRHVPSEKEASGSQPRELALDFSTTDWLTAREAARYLKVKVRTVLLWARQGKIKGHVLSGTKRHVWRFLQTDLDAALLESPVLPSEAPSVCPAERMGK